MLKVFFFLIVVALTFWLGIKLYENPGYVLVQYGHWSISMRLAVALGFLLGTFLILYLLSTLIKSFFNINYRFRAWRKRRALKKSEAKSIEGIKALLEESWENAEKNLMKAAKGDEKFIHYLGAAKAAHELKSYENRDYYFHLAKEEEPTAEVAIGLFQLQLQINHEQWEQAYSLANHLKEKAPHNSALIQKQVLIYYRQQDAEALSQLLPQLKYIKGLSEEQHFSLEKMAYAKVFLGSIAKGNKQEIKNFWNHLPRYLQQEKEFILLYVDYLKKSHAIVEAENLLRNILKNSVDKDIIAAYCALPAENSQKKLQLVESWLTRNSEDSSILEALGNLCIELRLMDKAQHYLEKAYKLESSKALCESLGALNEALGNASEALKYYKEALRF